MYATWQEKGSPYANRENPAKYKPKPRSKGIHSIPQNSAYDTIKKQITLSRAVEYYGITPTRAGFIPCPLHSERTPSMKLYPDEHYHCFSCGAHGSVIDFVMALHGLSSADAVRRIDADFELGLDSEHKATAEEIRAAKAEREKREKVEAFKQWELEACITWATYCRMLERQKRHYMPKCPVEELHPLYVEVLPKLDYADYQYRHVFISDDFEAKAEFYKNNREEVKDIARYIRESGFTG